MSFSRLRGLGLSMAAALSVIACGQVAQPTSAFKFDSAHNIAVDGVITNGKILTTTTSDASIKAQVSSQLYYTIGQMNGMNGGVDMARLEVSVGEKRVVEAGLWEATYAAKIFISWPRETAVPANYSFIVPARGDNTGLLAFFQEYGADEHSDKKCLAWEAHEVAVSLLWYYYRPLKASCPLQEPTFGDPSVVVRIPLQLAISGQNTTGKQPEYAKMWQDGRLVATAIFGKYEDGATSAGDAGIEAYSEMYNSLLQTYGTPVRNSLPRGQVPSAANDDIRLTFNTVAGPLDVAIFLVDGIRSVGPEFDEKYNERTKISDFVSYSGHSGLGANIRALARKGTFVRGQHQLYFVNGCDTFAYVDNSLRDAHQVANPGSGPDKYFDIITNAMPSYFHMNAHSNITIMSALIGRTLTYREILSSFDDSQRAAVTGEQDNGMPF